MLKVSHVLQPSLSKDPFLAPTQDDVTSMVMLWADFVAALIARNGDRCFLGVRASEEHRERFGVAFELASAAPVFAALMSALNASTTEWDTRGRIACTCRSSWESICHLFIHSSIHAFTHSGLHLFVHSFIY